MTRATKVGTKLATKRSDASRPPIQSDETDDHEGIEDDVDEASWESFPASDAPSWTATGSGSLRNGGSVTD